MRGRLQGRVGGPPYGQRRFFPLTHVFSKVTFSGKLDLGVWPLSELAKKMAEVLKETTKRSYSSVEEVIEGYFTFFEKRKKRL